MPEADSPRERSFDEFYRAEYKKLVRVLMKQGARFGEAEDAAQVAMADAYRQWKNLRNPAAWVGRAAVRQHIKDRKRESRLKQLVEQVAHEERLDDPAAPDGVDSDEHARVSELLAQLPPAQRDVMALFLDGYKPQEIAELLGKKPVTVRTNLTQARKSLRQHLENERREETE